MTDSNETLDADKFNSWYFKSHIENLIRRYEGMGQAGDKSGWLIDAFLRYKEEGDLPDMEIKEGCFWKPRFGSAMDWMGFMDGLYSFLSGDNKDYLLFYKVLHEAGRKMIKNRIYKCKYGYNEGFMGNTRHFSVGVFQWVLKARKEDDRDPASYKRKVRIRVKCAGQPQRLKQVLDQLVSRLNAGKMELPAWEIISLGSLEILLKENNEND